MRWSSATVVLVLAALALTLGACGSSTPVEEEVEAAVIEGAETKDQKLFCRTMVTQHFIEEVFDGDVAACASSAVTADDPGKAVVEEVTMQGEEGQHALVAMRVEGGESDGLSGSLEYALEDEEWKLDRFGDDYLHSVFEAGIAIVDEGAVSTPQMKACMGKRIAALEPESLRNLTYDSLSDQTAAAKQLIGIAEECPRPLADYVAGEIAGALAEDGKGPAYVKCLRKELSVFIQLTGIAGELIVDNPSDASVAALQGLALGVDENCAGSK